VRSESDRACAPNRPARASALRVGPRVPVRSESARACAPNRTARALRVGPRDLRGSCRVRACLCRLLATRWHVTPAGRLSGPPHWQPRPSGWVDYPSRHVLEALLVSSRPGPDFSWQARTSGRLRGLVGPGEPGVTRNSGALR
jgi:hypothetical protein